MYHLGWFLPGVGVQPASAHGWTPSLNGPFDGRREDEWMKSEIYIDLAASLERAGFDYILFEDSNQVDDTFGGSAEATLRLGIFSPKHDPMPLVPMIAARTKHIGLVPTVSSTFYPPYLAARLLTTLDHLTEGRVGFNLVTSRSELAARNYGMDSLPPKDLRYEMANEWVDIVKGLQQSWDADAVVADRVRSIYADHTKVHRIDYAGKYYKSRGPLNTIPGPQRAIPMVEAGNSPAGRDLAARQADSLLALSLSVEGMKALRSDMHARLKGYGRDPSSFKVMFLCSPVIGRTDQEARERAAAIQAARQSPEGLETALWFLDQQTGLDFASFDLDMPVAEIRKKLEGPNSVLLSAVEQLFKDNADKTLREVVSKKSNLADDLGLVGSPETVAAKMDEMMQEVGGDGFLFNLPTRRVTLAEVSDGLSPVLQRRGSIRTGYEGKTFRDNLLAF